MATIKSFTSLEQSKKLAKILPLKSIDMCYIKHASSNNPNWEFNEDFPPMILGDVPINEIAAETLPCWSLAALLDILSKWAERVNEAGIAELSYEKITKWCVSMLNCGKIKDCYADNPVDACVAMIEKLHELNLL